MAERLQGGSHLARHAGEERPNALLRQALTGRPAQAEGRHDVVMKSPPHTAHLHTDLRLLRVPRNRRRSGDDPDRGEAEQNRAGCSEHRARGRVGGLAP